MMALEGLKATHATNGGVYWVFSKRFSVGAGSFPESALTNMICPTSRPPEPGYFAACRAVRRYKKEKRAPRRTGLLRYWEPSKHVTHLLVLCSHVNLDDTFHIVTMLHRLSRCDLPCKMRISSPNTVKQDT